MADINELHRRLDELEAELNAVLAKKHALDRNLRRRRTVLRAITLGSALAFVGCWALAAAATAGVGTRVVAPFEVLDEFNKPIFDVTTSPRAFHLYRLGGTYASAGVVTDSDAFYKVGPDANAANVVLGVKGKNPGMIFRYGGVDRDILRFGTTGGTGRMVMMNTSGTQDIIQFLTGLKGEGVMELNSAGGQLAVIASPSEGGFGRVEALPLGNPIGSFIVGRPKQ